MIFSETGNVSSQENLFSINRHGYIELFDTENGFLGFFEVWHDSNNEEFINLNGQKSYLSEIDEH